MSESRADYSRDSFLFRNLLGHCSVFKLFRWLLGIAFAGLKFSPHTDFMGTMDDQATGNSVIVCKEGSPATTVNAAGFSSWRESLASLLAFSKWNVPASFARSRSPKA